MQSTYQDIEIANLANHRSVASPEPDTGYPSPSTFTNSVGGDPGSSTVMRQDASGPDDGRRVNPREQGERCSYDPLPSSRAPLGAGKKGAYGLYVRKAYLSPCQSEKGPPMKDVLH